MKLATLILFSALACFGQVPSPSQAAAIETRLTLLEREVETLRDGLLEMNRLDMKSHGSQQDVNRTVSEALQSLGKAVDALAERLTKAEANIQRNTRAIIRNREIRYGAVR